MSNGAAGHEPRACLRCWRVQDPDAFDMGPSGRRRRKVCKDCVAAEHAEREQRLAEYRATFQDPETGEWMRRCSSCRVVKPMTRENFGPSKNMTAGFQYECYPCKRPKVAEVNNRRRRDPVRGAEMRRRELERLRERLDDPVTGPELRERRRETERRSRARRRAEREAERRAGWFSVDAGPVAAAIVADAERDELPVGVVCERLGVNPRQLRRWQSGEGIRLRRLEEMVLVAEWEWESLWPLPHVDHDRVRAWMVGDSSSVLVH